MGIKERERGGGSCMVYGGRFPDIQIVKKSYQGREGLINVTLMSVQRWSYSNLEKLKS